MATTTNYGWTTPNDTDLLKDGAAAIRTLGSSIDSTVFTNAGAAIAKTIVDAKGDIIAATAADTVARLAVGANDTVLTADSSQATGLKWAASAAGGMTLINSGGTTLTGSSVSIQSIPATYNDLIVYLVAAQPATNNAFPAMIYNNDGTAKYRYAYDNADNQTFALSDLKLTDGNPNSNSVGLIRVEIPRYASTVSWKMNINNAIDGSHSTGTVTYRRSWGAWNQYGSAINRLDFYNNTGNWSSGTVFVYGVK
jgi:hypothetical protein